MAKFIQPEKHAAIKGANNKLPQPSLHQKFQIAALLRDDPDPTDKINDILKQIPGRPLIDGKKNYMGQLLGYERSIKKLIEEDDPEALKLGIEFGYCEQEDELVEAPIDMEEVQPLVKEPDVADGQRRKR